MSYRLLETPESFHNYIEKKLLQSEWKRVNQKRLINTLNRIDFQDGTIIINLKHPKYNKVRSLPAKPKSPTHSHLECLWADHADFSGELLSYQFMNFYLTDGLHLILVEAHFQDICKRGIRLELPETSYEISSRNVRRHLCDNITVELNQSGFSFNGDMIDFNSSAFSIDLSAVSSEKFDLINTIVTIDVIIRKEGEVLFTGPCEMVRQVTVSPMRIIVLRPLNTHIQRFKPKKIRSVRQKLIPSPNIVFKHPFTGRIVTLSVVDISSCGFSTMEDCSNSLLLPGMILPEVSIEFTKDMRIKCSCQVIYIEHEEGEISKSGLAILDMDGTSHISLSSLLYQAEDKNSYLCTSSIDLDELWKFFFESGFIYPEKYKFIQSRKDKFKKLYKKLYTESPEIARHITYQDNGVIHGHVSMFRFFNKTWLLHHHAAIRTKYNRAGLVVMENMLRYINEFHHISSSCMKYIACYYRPTNKFAKRVFGDAGRSLNDPKKSSIDSFAYFYFNNEIKNNSCPDSWQFTESDPNDLTELVDFYEHESGGLMLESMDLDNIAHDQCQDVSRLYKDLGFKRQTRQFSLKRRGKLKAVLLVNISDFGLNMSELSNCIKIIVIDSEGLNRDILYYSLSQAAVYYEENDIPVLMYPKDLAETFNLKWDKQYDLAILDLEYFGPYLQYIDKLIHRPSSEKIARLREKQ